MSNDGFLTPMEFAETMTRIKEKVDDRETRHIEMDTVMCNLLFSLGYSEGVEVFVHTLKWYA